MVSPVRLRVTQIVCAGIFLAIAIRIFYVQVLSRTFFQNLSEQQSTRVIQLTGQRGNIYDRAGRLLAEDVFSYSVWADPKQIRNKENTARTLAKLLREDPTVLREKIAAPRKRFVWLKRKVDYDVYQAVQQHKLTGVYIKKEHIRFYPQGKIAAHVLGFVNIDHQGLEGVELKYDHYLKGRDGWSYTLRDCKGQLLPKDLLVPARDGFNAFLTIDAQVQYWVEQCLEEAIKKYKAKGGSIVVMAPRTGQVVALASYPFFDPNNAYSSSADAIRNRAIADTYEPGSVFKAITLVASLKERTFNENDVLYCENGEYKIPGSILHDWKPYGKLSFAEVFEKSSNIGVAKIANALSPAILYNYIKKFRFGEATGIDLPGEVRGIVKKPERWSKTSRFIIPIGQEITSTNIQIAAAFSVIANGGYTIKPQIMDKIVSSEGVTIKEFPVNRSTEPVASAEVIHRATAILTRVVSQGTAKAAAIEGVAIAGKTGTAQKVEPGTAHYSKNRYVVSFVGFFPADQPEYVVSVSIDEPAHSQFGGVICAPVFKRIAGFLLKYRNSIQAGGAS